MKTTFVLAVAVSFIGCLQGGRPQRARYYPQPAPIAVQPAAPAAPAAIPTLISPPHPHPPVSYGAGVAVTATAPSWMNDSYLGAPLDQHFQPFRGAGAGSLFTAGALPPTTVATFESDYYKADKELEFEANLSTWFLDASVGYDQNNRFISQRARQLDTVHELNDRTAMSAAPAGAIWYVAKIYYGHIYETVLFERDTTLTASVAADFMRWGGDIHAFAQSRHLQERTIGRGLAPRTGSAIFAHTAAEVRDNFTTTGASVAIMVEYRSIPNASLRDVAIAWRP